MKSLNNGNAATQAASNAELGRRKSHRFTISGSLPVGFVDVMTKKQINCIAVDVSREGLGLVISQPVKCGTRIQLLRGESTIELHVKWCRVDTERSGIYNCGLLCEDTSVDLTNVFLYNNTEGLGEVNINLDEDDVPSTDFS